MGGGEAQPGEWVCGQCSTKAPPLSLSLRPILTPPTIRPLRHIIHSCIHLSIYVTTTHGPLYSGNHPPTRLTLTPRLPCHPHQIISQELMGHGNVFSPAPVVGMLFGGRREFAYAVCEERPPWPCIPGNNLRALHFPLCFPSHPRGKKHRRMFAPPPPPLPAPRSCVLCLMSGRQD